MERKLFAIVIGVFVWYVFNFVFVALLLKPNISSLPFYYSLIFLFTGLVGFLVASIAKEKRFLVVISTIVIAYVSLVIMLSIIGRSRSHLSSQPTFLIIIVIGVIFVAMAVLGAYLSTLIFNKKSNMEKKSC